MKMISLKRMSRRPKGKEREAKSLEGLAETFMYRSSVVDTIIDDTLCSQ